MRKLLLASLLIVATVIAVEVALLGDGSRRGEAEQGFESSGGGHVHGLGINPADGALFVASHNGLFRTAPGDRQARPVGTAGKDVMGFSVIGPNRFLGSGHPGEMENLPPSLGLIASTDAGRTFKPVSLLGEADFHVLRGVGTRIYGADSTSGRFLVSRDTGRTWSERRPPGTIVDLAIEPRDPDRLVASTDDGLFASDDAGRGWRRLGRQVALVAWPTPERLFNLSQEGKVSVSSDGGRRFRPTGVVPGEPVAFMGTGSDLHVALDDNRIMHSADGGATWKVRTRV